MQIISNIEQGTDEWFEMRLGVITASRFKDVLAKGKGITRTNYMMELAAERITSEKAEGFTNQYMEWGTQTEPQAIAMYEFDNAVQVDRITFVKHDIITAGYSPDGFVNGDGLIEVKCPKTTTQIETFLSGEMPSGHKPQVQGGLWISEREWCDFISFDPRIKTQSSYFCIRVYRDEDYIKNLELEVKRFEDELNELVSKL